jgi:HSP20 family protein
MKRQQDNQHADNSLLDDSSHPPPQLVPAVDIFETEEMVIVHTEMPGIDKEDVSINLKEDVLTISGSMVLKTNKGETFILKEFETVNYIRRFTIAETIDNDGIEASMSNGILTVKLPKIPPQSPRKIEIDVR